MTISINSIFSPSPTKLIGKSKTVRDLHLEQDMDMLWPILNLILFCMEVTQALKLSETSGKSISLETVSGKKSIQEQKIHHPEFIILPVFVGQVLLAV